MSHNADAEWRPDNDASCPGSAGILPAASRRSPDAALEADSSPVRSGGDVTGTVATRCKDLLVLCVPLLLSLIYMGTYPFSDRLARRTVGIRDLSAAQISNIVRAARAVDGTVLEPGEEFSFNRVVGPRAAQRGYRPAPSYLGNESPTTIGGGICLVSSLLYQIALDAGLTVTERFPHQRTIKTVPPGLDATVWYGRADLRFKNSLDCPLVIYSRANSGALTVELMGRPGRVQRSSIRRLVARQGQDRLTVEVYRQDQQGEKLVSRDLYRLAP
ncbi:MAG TPA: VanW family protein [Candidatus Obscuribacterales bacterium]